MKARCLWTLLMTAVCLVAPFFVHAEQIDFTQGNSDRWAGESWCGQSCGCSTPWAVVSPAPSNITQLINALHVQLGSWTYATEGFHRLYATTTSYTATADLFPSFDSSWVASTESVGTRDDRVQSGLSDRYDPPDAVTKPSGFNFSFPSNFSTASGSLVLMLKQDCDGRNQDDIMYWRIGSLSGATSTALTSGGTDNLEDMFTYVNPLSYETESSSTWFVIPNFNDTTGQAYSTTTAWGYCEQYTTSTGQFFDSITSGFMDALCMMAYGLFVPSNASLQSVQGAKDALSDRVPFGYFTSVSSTLGDFVNATGTAGNLDLTVPLPAGTGFATPTITIIDLSAINSNTELMGIFDIIKTFLRVALGTALFAFILYEITSHRAIKE